MSEVIAENPQVVKVSPVTTALEILNTYVAEYPEPGEVLDITTLSMSNAVFIKDNGFSVHGLLDTPSTDGMAFAYLEKEHLFKVVLGEWVYVGSLEFKSFEEIKWFFKPESKDLDCYTRIMIPFTTEKYLLDLGFNPNADQIKQDLTLLVQVADELTYCVDIPYTRRRSLRQLRIVADIFNKISAAIKVNLPVLGKSAYMLYQQTMDIFNTHRPEKKEKVKEVKVRNEEDGPNPLKATKVEVVKAYYKPRAYNLVMVKGPDSIVHNFNRITMVEGSPTFNDLSGMAKTLFEGVKRHLDKNFDVELALLKVNQRDIETIRDFTKALVKELRKVDTIAWV